VYEERIARAVELARVAGELLPAAGGGRDDLLVMANDRDSAI
jgi:hypothetical protein